MKIALGSLLASSLLVAACAAPNDAAVSAAADSQADGEAAAAAKLESLRSDPDGLLAFLTSMPKGGDLHNHLTGSIYAETYIAWAAADGMCIDTSTWTARAKAQCSGANDVAFPTSSSDALYSSIVDQWSMQDFTPSASESGHDHFFDTFSRWGAVCGAHYVDMLAQARTQAAEDNEQYLELMLGMASGATNNVANAVWGSNPEPTQADFAAYHQKLLVAPGWADAVKSASTTLDSDEAGVNAALGCGTADAKPACNVTTRYLYQASRSASPHQLFAGFVAAFEMAKADPRIVGLNLVGPEDGSVALADYQLQMQMLDYLHGYYAGTSPLHISLHAGELVSSVLPANDTQDLTFHIRQAVELGHAERIGHGVDVMGEDDSTGLLAELAQKNVLVEVCLSSNAEILLVSGAAHPLGAYRAANVPVALGTDDLGVARSNMSKEHLRAVTDQKLGYVDLKTMARASMEHSFLPGASLWANVATKTTVDACAGDTLGGTPSAGCQAFLASSERATEQWRLEGRYASFEASIAP